MDGNCMLHFFPPKFTVVKCGRSETLQDNDVHEARSIEPILIQIIFQVYNFGDKKVLKNARSNLASPMTVI